MAFCFEFFVTNVERDGQFLKLWGHKDRNAALNVERTIQQSFRDFEKGVGVPDPRTLMPNLFCCARYTDGAYYRAKVTHVDWNNGNVFVFFIDYGNGDRVPMSDLRSLDPSSVLLKIPPQASCFFLAGVVGTWEPAILDHIKNIILYNELKALVTQSIGQHNVLKLYMERNQDFSETLVRAGFASEVSPENFEVMVWRASAGSTTQGLPAAYSIPNPMWSMMHRPSYPNLMNPGVLPMQPPAVAQPLPTPTTATAVDMRKSSFPIYPSLDLNSEHSVFISFCDSDTKTIYVQLSKDQSELEKISETLNTPVPHLRQMCPPFVPGRICIARSSEDEVLYRAVITKISSDVEVYFVDYGNVDHVKPSEVYEIPSDLSHLQVMAIPFSFADDLDVSDELFGTVMELVNEKPAILQVVASKDVGTKQFCNLFIEETNVIDAARTELLKREPKLAFRNMPVPTPGGKVKVTVAYVKSVDNFYVQLAASQQDLESLMADVNSYCNSSAAKMQPSDIQPGAPCCALFPADGQWYRAMITNARLEELSVMYVDYGNEERVTMADLRVANEPIVNKLLAQAIPCRLSGFDAKPDKQLDQRFEELVIEESFTMHVVKIITEVPCIVVKLLDDSGVDIASKLHSAPVPIHHLNGNAIAPPCDVKVGVSSSGEREVVLSRGSSFHPRSINGIPVGQHQEKDNTHCPPKVGSVDRESVRSRESSFHPRSINGKPVSQYQGGEDSYCPKKDPVAWGIGEHQKQGPAFGHCDRSATSTYDTSEDAPSIQYSCMAIGDQKPVVIVFSNSPKDFYVQYRPADSKFDLLTEQIEQMFADGGDTLDRSMVVVGTACVAKYTEDGCYYRAEIKQVQRDGALVNFVDYGNMEVVSFDDLKRIPKSLCALQAQAFHCSLKGVPNCSQDTVKSKFNELLDSQSLVAEILDVKDHLYQIILRDSNESLSINEKFGALSSDLLSPNSTVKSVPNLCFPDGTVSEITVTWFKSPDNFCVRQKSLEEDFDQMMTQIQKEYKKKECVAAPSIGDAVIVKHTDGYYYRATVCILRGTKFGVKFIDFGDKCLVDPSAIFGLELQYSSLPALAIQCHLDAVKPVRGDQFLPYSTDISELFGGDLMCTFTSHSPSGYLVNCKRNGQDLAQQLIAKKLALSSLEKDLQKLSLSTNKNKRELKEGSEHTSIFSYIVSPDEFYLHLENEASDLENLQAELQTCANSMQAMPGKPAPGTICMAIFEDAWYRGLVLPNSSIFYLDYGNTEAYPEDENNVRMLPEHLQEMPGFAVRCQFELPLNSKWAPNALEQLTQYFEEAETLPLQIHAVKPNSFVVTIKNVSDKLGLVIVEELLSASCGVGATIVNFTSPDDFYMHLDEHSDQVEEVARQLLNADLFPKSDEWNTGDTCAALFDEDNLWYRAEIVSISEPYYVVRYVDYGNESTTHALRKLPENLMIPPLGYHCALPLPSGLVWNEPAKAYLQELVDSESKFEVEFLTKDDPILVNLKSNNLNINHELASCCGYEKDLIEAHIASLRASVEGNENVALELPPNENAAPTSGDIATSNEVSVSLMNSNEFKPVEFSDMEDVTVRDVDTVDVVNGAEVLEILDVTSTATSERKSSTDDVQILFESGESSLGGSVVEIPVEHSVITIGVASELPPNENAALTSGDIAPSNEVSVSLTNSNEFKPVESSDMEEITVRDVDTENVVNGAEVLEILDVTCTATGEMKSSTDDVQILFESRESSLDGSVVEIPVEHSVITIGDDSDDEIVEHCPKSSEAMPDLITPMESSNRNTGGNCDVDQDITHLVESFCQSLSLVNGNGADSLPDVHCGIEKDTIVSCPEIGNLLPNTECQPWSVASLHTYPNSQACEIDVEGTCLGYCKAEPSDLDLDVSSFTPGTKFYIFDDCEVHRSIVTVRSSIK